MLFEKIVDNLSGGATHHDPEVNVNTGRKAIFDCCQVAFFYGGPQFRKNLFLRSEMI